MGITYEFSKFEYVLPVFVDHTSKCDQLAVKMRSSGKIENPYSKREYSPRFWCEDEECVVRCVYMWELNIRYRRNLACRVSLIPHIAYLIDKRR